MYQQAEVELVTEAVLKESEGMGFCEKPLSQFSQIFSRGRETDAKKKGWEILQKFNYTEFTKNQIRIWRSLKLKFHWLHFINQEAKFWSLLVSKVILDMTIKAIRPKNLGPWFQKIKPVILDIL